MSESNVIEFPIRGHLLDANHERLRKFFELVADAAEKHGVVTYTVAALHSPYDGATEGCVHADSRGIQNSIDGVWVDETLGAMSEVIDELWMALQDKVNKNIDAHEASDAAKAAREDEPS